MSAHPRQSLHSEDGWILVTSITLLALMVSIALASYAFVDSGSKRSREQRERETALNITEGVMYSQGFALAASWPGNAEQGAALPTSCTQSTPSTQTLCPNPNGLAAANSSTPDTANFATVDARSGVTWSTRVRDNGGGLAGAFVMANADAAQQGTNVRTGQAYTCAAPCRWDANGDRQIWVQARTVVRGRPRNVVSLLKREVFAEAFPRNGVTAGSFETTNQGNKTIINSTGSQVVVRCASTSASCTDYNTGKSQVLPAQIVRDPTYPPAMTAAQIARFREAARTASPATLYTSCPSSLTGTVVFIDVPAGTVCEDENNGVYNSSTEPGVVIMPRGTLELKGTYYGLLYLANGQNSSGPVLTLAANSEVFGGVAIDGPGRLVAGQASGNRATITFVGSVFDSLSSYGTTGLVQNTWRELGAS